MSCKSCGEIDLTPCSPAIPVDPIPYTKKCNPCKKDSCVQKMDARCVVYKWNQFNCGENLKYINVSNNENLENIIEEIDNTFNKLTKPTLINCFVEKTGINLTTYRLNDLLLKLQEQSCLSVNLSTASLKSMLETIRDTPELKNIFCQIVSTC